MRLFDTHCHLMDDGFVADIADVISRARAAGVERIIIPAVDVQSAKRAIAIAEAYDGIYVAVGIHPEAGGTVDTAPLAEVSQLAEHPRVVAIGEIGLDYHWDVTPRADQQAMLAHQIELAKTGFLPVIIHNRDATADTLRVLQAAKADAVGGVMHCFTGSYEIAMEAIQLGFYISFGGPVTFKNARNVREVAAQIPLEWLLIETDAPYLTPHPFRGQRNEPAHVKLVAEQLAALRGMSVEEIADITYQNACRLFRVEASANA